MWGSQDLAILLTDVQMTVTQFIVLTKSVVLVGTTAYTVS